MDVVPGADRGVLERELVVGGRVLRWSQSRYLSSHSPFAISGAHMSDELWTQLISGQRLRPSAEPAPGDEGNEFLSDYYRVAFSSSFRRLQDKTQVSPLAATDYVRRRLTHSVEVAVLGERMGRVVAKRLREHIGAEVREQIGKIVASACLLHDIGNPPFGHEGEAAIRSWADEQNIESADYRCFDGNAQGFRIAVRLQHQGRSHGMNLTAATLATMLKYPAVPEFDTNQNPLPKLRKRGKWSVMSSEEQHYRSVRELVGLDDGKRHPLSYIVEAADDIVNRLVDIEDAMKLKLVTYADVRNMLQNLKHPVGAELLGVMDDRCNSIALGSAAEKELWAYQVFRVKAATMLAEACEQVFENEIAALETGGFKGDLVGNSELQELYQALEQLETEKIFSDPGIVRVEAGGNTAIKGLLTLFLDHVKNDTKLAATVPQFPTLETEMDDPHAAVRRVVDYVSGMTDRYAIALYQELSGVSL